MIERYDGLTSSNASDFPGLTMRQFLNPLNHTTGGAATTVPEFSFTVPTSLKVSIPYIIHGNPTVTANFQCRTAPGGGGSLYTVIMGASDPTSGQVHVEPGTGMLLFHSSAASTTVYIRMVAQMSYLDAAYFAWLHANCLKVYEHVFGATTTYVAGEDVVIGPGYVGSDGGLYQADPSTLEKVATVFILQSVSVTNYSAVQRQGSVTPKRSMPPNRDIFAGRGGEVTWMGDEDPTYKLQTNDYQQFLGKSDHLGTTLFLNVVVPVSRFAE